MPQMMYTYEPRQNQPRPGGTPQLLREQNNEDTYIDERRTENGSSTDMSSTEVRSSEMLSNGMMGSGNGMMMSGMGNATASMPGMQNSDGLHMESMLSVDMLDGPTSSGEMLRASLKGLLMRNIGFYVVVSFLVGTAEPVVWEGILHSVGTDYILLYQPDLDRYISGDIYSLKFVEFHNTRTMTPWAGYRRYDGMSSGW